MHANIHRSDQTNLYDIIEIATPIHSRLDASKIISALRAEKTTKMQLRTIEKLSFSLPNQRNTLTFTWTYLDEQ